MAWVAVAGAATSAVIGSALSDGGGGSSGGGAAAAADPFAAERAQYLPQLKALMDGNQNFGQSQAQQALNKMLGFATAPTRGAMLTPAIAATPGTPASAGSWGSDWNGSGSDAAQAQAHPYFIPGSPGTPGTPAVAATYAPDTPGSPAGASTFDSTDPSYKWRFDQGLEAVNRSAGAAGMLGSGNRMVALMNYGQGAASTEYQAQFNRFSGEASRQYSQESADYSNQFSRLSQLSGANSGQPGAAGQILANQGAAQNQAAGAVASTLGNAASGAISSWLNQPASSGSNWNTGGGTANNPSAYTSDNSSLGYIPDTNNYSPVW